MFQYIKKMLKREGGEPAVPIDSPELARKEEFANKLIDYSRQRMGDGPAFEIIEELSESWVFYRTPKSLNLDGHEKSWGILVESDTGAVKCVAVFLDFAPMDQVVEEFFHGALPELARLNGKTWQRGS